MNKTTSTIEFVQGKETHSSSWAKFYVKGLNSFQVKEDFEQNRQDKHHSYQGFTCLEVPDNAVFTIFEQSGDKNGTQNYFLLNTSVTFGTDDDGRKTIAHNQKEIGKYWNLGDFWIAQIKTGFYYFDSGAEAIAAIKSNYFNNFYEE